MSNKIVIYTAIFGRREDLQEPTLMPPECDFICFTDLDITSETWQIRNISSPEKDPRRASRHVKILPHRYLKEYEYSIWIDANLTVRGNVPELIDRYLRDANMAVFSRAQTFSKKQWPKIRDVVKKIPGYSKIAQETLTARKKIGLTSNSPAAFVRDPIDDVYEEARYLIERAKQGRVNADPELIQKQMDAYRADGYPTRNGMSVNMVLVRRHNTPDVIKTMEAWWVEYQKYTPRDQLSFNYVAWKQGFSFVYMDGNSRDNPYFVWTPHQQ